MNRANPTAPRDSAKTCIPAARTSLGLLTLISIMFNHLRQIRYGIHHAYMKPCITAGLEQFHIRCQKNIGVTKLRARKMQTVHLVNCSHLPNLLSATTNLRCIGDDLRGNPMQLLYLRLFHRLTDALNFEPQNTAVKNGVPTRSNTIYQREDRLTLVMNALL